MTVSQKVSLWSGLTLTALIAASWLSSALFQAYLGQPGFQFWPWEIWLFYTLLPQYPAFQIPWMACLLIPHVGVIAAAIMLLIPRYKEELDSRWADLKDIKQANMLKNKGMVLGRYKGRLLINDDPTHALLVGPTRSGKGTGIVVPNLLMWPHSAVVLDVKHENYKKTAGYRASYGHQVYMWSPLDPDGKSHRYNPLQTVRKDPYHRITDLQIIAGILMPTPGHSNPMWPSEAQSLFVGLALYVMDSADHPATIGAIYRLLCSNVDLGELVKHLLDKHPYITGAARAALSNFAHKAEKERSGVKSSLTQAINLWKNPIVDAATSASDFRIEDLRKKRMAVYIGVLPGQIQNASPLLRLFIEQVISTLSQKEPGEDEPLKVLMVIDEFAMLGKIQAITSAFTLLAGYNIRVMAVVQGLKWIDIAYGRDMRDALLSCCAHQIFFSANDPETARYISESCGETTITMTTKSSQKSYNRSGKTKTESQRKSPLLAPQIARRLGKNRQIIITEECYPIKAEKIAYFKDSDFKDRHAKAPIVPALKVKEFAPPIFNLPSKKRPTPSQSSPPEAPPAPLLEMMEDPPPINPKEIRASEFLLGQNQEQSHDGEIELEA